VWVQRSSIHAGRETGTGFGQDIGEGLKRKRVDTEKSAEIALAMRDASLWAKPFVNIKPDPASVPAESYFRSDRIEAKGSCVPYVPSDAETVSAMLSIAEIQPGDVLIDLGSGDGRILIEAAKEYDIRSTGIEIEPGRVWLARERAREAGVDHLVKVIEGNFFDAELSGASVVTMFLLPGINDALRPKLERDLSPGARVVSHRFLFRDWKPARVIEQSSVFCWVIGAS
jgi:Mycolic acid cyclopropane synthetase